MKFTDSDFKSNKEASGTKGLCFVCGIDTKINVHQSCGKIEKDKGKHHTYTLKIPRKYKDCECNNLDCLKMYTPTSATQKFCQECRKKYNKK